MGFQSDINFQTTRPDAESENPQNHIFSKTSGKMLHFGGEIIEIERVSSKFWSITKSFFLQKKNDS